MLDPIFIAATIGFFDRARVHAGLREVAMR